MSPIKSMADIPSPLKHNEIFKEYQQEIMDIKIVDYAKILGTSKQNISTKLKNDSCLLYKERDRLIQHLEQRNFIDIPLYSKLIKIDAQEVQTSHSNIPIKYEVSASCGNGVDVYDEESQDMFSLPNNFLQYFKADVKASEVIFAEGNPGFPCIPVPAWRPFPSCSPFPLIFPLHRPDRPLPWRLPAGRSAHRASFCHP